MFHIFCLIFLYSNIFLLHFPYFCSVIYFLFCFTMTLYNRCKLLLLKLLAVYSALEKLFWFFEAIVPVFVLFIFIFYSALMNCLHTDFRIISRHVRFLQTSQNAVCAFPLLFQLHSCNMSCKLL